MRLKPFRIEQYYARYEFSSRFMLADVDVSGFCEQLVAEASVLLLPARCTTSPGMSASASAGRTCPRRWSGSTHTWTGSYERRAGAPPLGTRSRSQR
jgi:hypothetical protein